MRNAILLCVALAMVVAGGLLIFSCGPTEVQASADLSSRLNLLEEENIEMRSLLRELAICADAQVDSESLHRCAHRWRFHEKGWEAP